MPITAIYDVGTVDLVTDSDEVVGTGVAWIGAAIREGDIFWADGLSVRVLELIDDTTIRLAHPWPGANRTGRSYEIQYTPDASRVMSQTTDLLRTMDQGGIGPLKNLNPVNNRAAYYTSNSTSALYPITGLGRQLVGGTNANAMRNILELVFGDSQVDMTGTKILRRQDFGLGSITPSPITDIDSITLGSGFYRFNPDSGLGTAPISLNVWCGVLVFSVTSSICNQIFFNTQSPGEIYVRRHRGVEWSNWYKIAIET